MRKVALLACGHEFAYGGKQCEHYRKGEFPLDMMPNAILQEAARGAELVGWFGEKDGVN